MSNNAGPIDVQIAGTRDPGGPADGIDGSTIAEPDSAHLKPLAGVRILDWTEGVAGPYACQMLADMGADVIKIERPQGDWGRGMGGGPHFRAVNRNKRDICLDLRVDGARDIALQLISQADVMVTSYRPGVLEKYGLGFSEVVATRPSLIVGRVTAYGYSGRLSRRPASDTTMQAVSGLMSQIGDPDGHPTRLSVPLLDLVAGRDLALGILAALLARQRGEPVTGPVDVNLFASAGSALLTAWQDYLETGTAPRRTGRQHPALAPAGLYETADGRVVAMAVLRDEHWRRLCAALALDDLVEDSRFARSASRLEHREELDAVIARAFADRPFAEVMEVMQRHDVLVEPVNEIDDIGNNEELLECLPLLGDAMDGISPGTEGVGLPILFGSHRLPVDRTAAPERGQHTREVLVSAGYPETEVDGLIRAGVVLQYEPVPSADKAAGLP